MADTPWLAGKLFTDASWLSSFDAEGGDEVQLSSIDNGGNKESVTLIFLNDSANPLTLCWVDDRGYLHHFYVVNPSRGPQAIQVQPFVPSTRLCFECAACAGTIFVRTSTLLTSFLH